MRPTPSGRYWTRVIWRRHDGAGHLYRLLDGHRGGALTAATAIGDDRLQREAGGRVVPDSFTHGSSEQRVRWFRVGFERGSLEACDTFKGEI